MLETVITVVATLVTALGGVELVKFLNTRKAARQVAATSAKSEEWNVAEKIYERHEGMLEAKSKKIEELYHEIGKLKEEKLTLTAEKNDLLLTNKMLLMQKCEVRGCANRKPPSEY